MGHALIEIPFPGRKIVFTFAVESYLIIEGIDYEYIEHYVVVAIFLLPCIEIATKLQKMGFIIPT